MSEIPQSFLEGMSDINAGRVTPMDIIYESADYNRGYMDGMNQARKEERDLLEKLLSLITSKNIHKHE